MRNAFTRLPTRLQHARRHSSGCRHGAVASKQSLPLVERLQCELGDVNIEDFKARAFLPGSPLHITRRIPHDDTAMMEHHIGHRLLRSSIPATNKWFETYFNRHARTLNQRYLRPFSPTILPYELSTAQGWSQGTGNAHNSTMHKFITGLKANDPGSTFHNFNAPLSLMLEAAETYSEDGFKLAKNTSDSGASCLVPSMDSVWNRDGEGNELRGDALIAAQSALKSRVDSWDELRKGLYIAQAQIIDLPKQLQEDLPTPDLVKHAGKGDIYDANIWIGIPPTYTPLHKDPNPNLFFQLAGIKCVRLFKPSIGAAIFRKVQSQVGNNASATFRGEEMMAGPERMALEEAVWGRRSTDLDGLEVLVGTGDALFIPKGWWHSIKSFHDMNLYVNDGISASVNWWFR